MSSRESPKVAARWCDATRLSSSSICHWFNNCWSAILAKRTDRSSGAPGIQMTPRHLATTPTAPMSNAEHTQCIVQLGWFCITVGLPCYTTQLAVKGVDRLIQPTWIVCYLTEFNPCRLSGVYYKGNELAHNKPGPHLYVLPLLLADTE